MAGLYNLLALAEARAARNERARQQKSRADREA